MSRAFVKEPDGDDMFEDELPDRTVSTEPNLVTQKGLALLNEEVVRLHEALDDARKANDGASFAEFGRDLRYWQARRAHAQLVAPPEDDEEVRFGHTVTIERDDGRRQTYKIVGEDEANPSKGLLSHVSPLAVAMFGKKVGSVVTAGHNEAEIVSIKIRKE